MLSVVDGTKLRDIRQRLGTLHQKLGAGELRCASISGSDQSTGRQGIFFEMATHEPPNTQISNFACIREQYLNHV
jgi:hypothetical protein